MADVLGKKDSGGNRGGMTVTRWLARFFGPEVFLGDEIVTVTCRDGSTRDVPRREAALVFRNLRSVRGAQAMNAYLADTICPEPVLFSEGIRASMGDIIDHPVAKNMDIIWPLGIHNGSNSNVCFQQVARQWVTGGKNDGQMRLDNIINTVYSILQSLIWKAVNDNKKTDQAWTFKMAGYVAQAFHQGYYLREENVRKVTQALCMARAAQDMTQRTIAFVLRDEEPSKRNIIEILETSVFRGYRGNGWSIDFLENGFAGLMTVLVAVPLLRSHIHGGLSIDTMQDRFENGYMQIVELCCGLFSGEVECEDEEKNAMILNKIIEVSGTVIPEDAVTAFLTHVGSSRHQKRFDWESHGVLEPIMGLDFEIDLETKVSVNGRARAKVPTVTPEEDGYHCVPPSVKDWAGLCLPSDPATYIIQVEVMGMATKGRGNTKGKELNANIVFTAGGGRFNSIVKNGNGSYSPISGMHYNPVTRNYERRAPFNTERELTLQVLGDRWILTDASARSFVCEYTGENPLIGFKNCFLIIRKQPEPEPEPEEPPAYEEVAPIGAAAGPPVVPPDEPTAAALLKAARDLAKARNS